MKLKSIVNMQTNSVHILNTFKLYRDFAYCVPRGTALIITETFGYLWTKGFISRIQT